MRRVAVLVPLILAGLAVAHYLDDLRARDPIRQAVSEFTIDLRRPLDMELIGYAPSADIATQVLAIAALSDALGTARLAGLSPVERRAWLDVPLYVDEELSAAIDGSLDAMARNPGWPLHRYFVGKLAYTRDRRSLGGEVLPDSWLLPLKSAYHDAPHHEPTTETLAAVLLESWRVSPETDRAMLPGVLSAAFVDPGFVRIALDVAIDVLGREQAFGAVPESPAPLAEAVRTIGRRGDITGAAELLERWERAEWQSREHDLEAIRERRRMGDWRGLLAATSNWISQHSVRDFDSDEGLRQVKELLRHWPRDEIGSWGGDRRSDMIRFFLDGRLDLVDPALLDTVASSLAHVPAPIMARVALAAGSEARAESLVRAAGSEGAFEWTDYFVDLARRAIARDDVDAAKAAIDRISPSARRECDVLIVRRQAGESLEAPGISVVDDSGEILDEAWSTNGMLGICVDPVAMAGRTLVVDLATEGPAILEWGLNTGRRDTLLVDGPARIELPLSGLTGRNVVYTKVLWGDGLVRRSARVR